MNTMICTRDQRTWFVSESLEEVHAAVTRFSQTASGQWCKFTNEDGLPVYIRQSDVVSFWPVAAGAPQDESH